MGMQQKLRHMKFSSTVRQRSLLC